MDAASLAGRAVRETIDFIADAISPIDGTQDAEAGRESLWLALAELLSQQPDADLTSLTQVQIERVVESYISFDITKRVELDVGAAVYKKAVDLATAMQRVAEMRSFIRQCVALNMRQLQARGEQFTRQSAARMSRRVIRYTFDVFEDYLS